MDRPTVLARLAKRIENLSAQVKRNRKRIRNLENNKRASTARMRALQRQVKRFRDIKEFQRKMKK